MSTRYPPEKSLLAAGSVTREGWLWQSPKWSKKARFSNRGTDLAQNPGIMQDQTGCYYQILKTVPFYEIVISKVCYPGSTFESRGPLRAQEEGGMWTSTGTKSISSLKEGQTCWLCGQGQTGGQTGNQGRIDKTQPEARHWGGMSLRAGRAQSGHKMKMGVQNQEVHWDERISKMFIASGGGGTDWEDREGTFWGDTEIVTGGNCNPPHHSFDVSVNADSD